MTDTEIAAFIIDEFEAGHPPGQVTEDPDDYGGLTRWGITMRYAAKFLRQPIQLLPRAVVRDLSRDHAVDMLMELELRRTGLWAIPDWRVKLATVDFNFNAGQDDGTPTLQRVVGVTADGAFGPRTLEAVGAADPLVTAVRVVAERVQFHARNSEKGARCVTCKLPRQKKWLGGWANRCARILEQITETTS